MLPIVKSLTISDVAKETGKSWEMVALEKMKADLLFWVPVIGGFLLLRHFFL